MNDAQVTVSGNLVSDPEVRFTQSGIAVANINIAVSSRVQDKQTKEWKDGETTYLRATAWRELAENVAETLTKGNRIIASGRLKQRNFETKEGDKRSVLELEVDEIGPSLKYATAKVSKAGKSANTAPAESWGSSDSAPF